MEIFKSVFNKITIYQTLFFSIKGVLTYPTLEELKTNNDALYKCWLEIVNRKYSQTILNLMHDRNMDTIYKTDAPYYPEFTKIISITYGKFEIDKTDGISKPKIKTLCNDDEYVIIATFMDELHRLFDGEFKSEQFLALGGHNVINYDIPFLLKRYLKHIDSFDNKLLPTIIKDDLGSKPWESMVIDLVNVWKFNGYGENTSLELIAESLGLKRTVNILSADELSGYYWENVEINKGKTLNYIASQSRNHVNLTIGLMNKLRQL